MEAALVEDKPYSFRPHLSDDIPFIQNSWGRSYYAGFNGNQILSPEEFHSYHRPIREFILNKPTTSITLCVSTEDTSHILGYSIAERPPKANYTILHYLYMKHAFKGEKLGQELLKKTIAKRPVIYTHSTIIAGKILKKFKEQNNPLLGRFIFCPHII